MARCWEDIPVGEKKVSPAVTITDAMISIIVGLSGMTSPYFLDEEYAKTTPFGTRIAPGRLTLLFMGGLGEQALGEQIHSGASYVLLGFDSVKFYAPLKAGDTIKVESEITGKRVTSRRDMGIVYERRTCKNQRGETIAEEVNVHLVGRRPE